MGTMQVLQVGADGLLPGVWAVAFHGQIGANQTPARRQPVLADAEGRLVRVVEERRSQGEVVVEVEEVPLAEGNLPGIGTRISPVPARLGNLVVIVGERERKAGLVRRAHEEGLRVEEFVNWLGGNEPRDEGLGCERVGDVVVWYCNPQDGYELWKRIQAAAEDEFYRALAGDRHALMAVSFWLSRASVTEHGIYLAAVGLRRAGSPHWRTLLDNGVRNRTEEERRQGLEDAEWLLKNTPRVGPIGSGTQVQRSASKKLREHTTAPAKTATMAPAKVPH